MHSCVCSTGVEGLTGYELTVEAFEFPAACGDLSVTYQISEVKT